MKAFEISIACVHKILCHNHNDLKKFLRPFPVLLLATLVVLLAARCRPKEEKRGGPETVNISAAVQPAHMVLVKGGTFDMGYIFPDDVVKYARRVTVGDFYLSKFEVTFDEFDAFCMATDRTKFADNGWGRGRRPVINVDWYDAVEYCNWLSTQSKLTPVYTIDKTTEDPNIENFDDIKKWTVTADWSADGYRLPTEAEWEYAARNGGKNEKWAGTSDQSQLGRYANTAGITDGYDYTAPVGSFQPNGLGIYDLTGNLVEWCWDWYGPYSSEAQINPTGPDTGNSRIYRGGSWSMTPTDARVAVRDNDEHIAYHDLCLGFRLARKGSF